MYPYRPSAATHLLSAAVASALIGGGLTAVLQLSPGAMGLVALLPVALWVGAILAAIAEDRLRTALLGVGLTAVPSYALMILQVVALEKYPTLGWVMLGLAVVVIAQALFAGALATGPRLSPTRGGTG
jgi:hypothetical protein